MKKDAKISPLIRITSGILGILGFVAIAFNAVQDGGFRLTFFQFASFFAGFIFLFVASFGKYPWVTDKGDDDK